jgi:undecaprenol kinase/diacylglycerol kinase (ATP)
MNWLKSYGYAWNGLKKAFVEERNLKIQAAAASIVIFLAFYFQISAWEWIALLIVIALVIGLELINTAIENLTDLVMKEHHPLAGKIKDISAGAVLFAAAISVIVGFIIFAKYFKMLIAQF